MRFNTNTSSIHRSPGSRRMGLALVALLFTAALLRPAPSAADDAGLWEQAVVLLKQHCWLPGKITIHELTCDLKGKPVQESRMEIGLSPDGRHRVQRRLMAAEEDGTDLTAKLRPAIDGSLPLSELAGDLFPYLEANGELAYQPNGKHRDIDGRRCTGFAFTFTEEGKHIQGTVWLDRKTSLPMEIHSQISSVPFTEEDVRITEYAQIEYFMVDDGGRCMLERTKARMTIEIPKLGFKGTVITSRVCEAHWKAASSP